MVEIRKTRVGPIDCYIQAKELLGEQYFLFWGIIFVGSLIAGVVPLVLVGPMYCGMGLCMLERTKGRAEFNTLFKGFDHFVPSLIGTLLFVVVSFATIIPLFIVMVIGAVVVGASGGEPALTIVGCLILGTGYFLCIVLSCLFYPILQFVMLLIVDKNLEPWPAVSAAFGSVLKNFWGMVGMALVGQLIILIGLMLCVVPGILAIPLVFTGHFVAYQKIFGSSKADGQKGFVDAKLV